MGYFFGKYQQQRRGHRRAARVAVSGSGSGERWRVVAAFGSGSGAAVARCSGFWLRQRHGGSAFALDARRAKGVREMAAGSALVRGPQAVQNHARHHQGHAAKGHERGQRL